MSRANGCRAPRRSTRLARLELLEPRTLLSAAAAPFHGLTGQGQTVVVIDSGIDYLQRRAWAAAWAPDTMSSVDMTSPQEMRIRSTPAPTAATAPRSPA